jgi:transposase
MPNPYDMALRERAVAAYERGDRTYAEVAATFVIDSRTLGRWVARTRATGSLAPFPQGGGWRSPIDLSALRAVVSEAPDATVAELCWEYNRRVPSAARTTDTSFRRAMRRDGYVLKKNGRGRVRSIGRTSRRNGTRF